MEATYFWLVLQPIATSPPFFCAVGGFDLPPVGFCNEFLLGSEGCAVFHFLGVSCAFPVRTKSFTRKVKHLKVHENELCTPLGSKYDCFVVCFQSCLSLFSIMEICLVWPDVSLPVDSSRDKFMGKRERCSHVISGDDLRIVDCSVYRGS